MAWFKKGKDKNKKPTDKQAHGGVTASSTGQARQQQTGSLKSQSPAGKSADIRAQALANARMAREAIGEETLQKIASALRKKQESPLEQAKARIAKLTEDDATRVAEEILSMLETRH